jgi:hypothetical protein
MARGFAPVTAAEQHGWSDEPFGCRDVHRIKGFGSALDVEADRIDHAKRASNRPGDRRPLVNIRCNGPELRIIAAGRVRPP